MRFGFQITPLRRVMFALKRKALRQTFILSNTEVENLLLYIIKAIIFPRRILLGIPTTPDFLTLFSSITLYVDNIENIEHQMPTYDNISHQEHQVH